MQSHCIPSSIYMGIVCDMSTVVWGLGYFLLHAGFVLSYHHYDYNFCYQNVFLVLQIAQTFIEATAVNLITKGTLGKD